MNSEVSAKVRHLDELAVAVSALVGFLARVQSHVRLEVVIAGESLLTDATAERLLARVSPLVVLQHVLVAEGPVARPAGEDFVAARDGVHRVARALRWFRRRR